MTLIAWVVSGILALDIIRLALDIWTNRKITHSNAMLNAQRMRWNQMCDDMAPLCSDEGEKADWHTKESDSQMEILEVLKEMKVELRKFRKEVDYGEG